MINYIILTHTFQTLEEVTDHRSGLIKGPEQINHVGKSFVVSELEPFPVSLQQSFKVDKSALVESCELLKLVKALVQLIILKHEFSIEEVFCASKHLPLQYCARSHATPIHSGNNQCRRSRHRERQFPNFFKIEFGHIVVHVMQLNLGREEHALNTQAISTKVELDQFSVPSLRLTICALHRHDRPRRCANSQQARQQRLKIKDYVSPGVSARLAFNHPRRSKQHWRNDNDYQRKSHQTHNSFLVARRHLNPRQRHVADVSHFLRESGSRLQPNLVAANTLRSANLLWKRCPA